jgi:hypothetical protein
MPPAYVFDVNETLLDVAALDPLFERAFGDPGAREAWFQQLIHSALVTIATGAISSSAGPSGPDRWPGGAPHRPVPLGSGHGAGCADAEPSRQTDSTISTGAETRSTGMGDAGHFALLVLVVGAAITAAVLSNQLSERLRVPSAAIFLLAAAVASDVMPTLGRLSATTVQRVVSLALVVMTCLSGVLLTAPAIRRMRRDVAEHRPRFPLLSW